MNNKIPEEVVERIRQSVDITDVISEHVQLKKQGRNYFGLCPFHGESTPSFSVSPDKQIFHCFGCGEGGNALSFIMKMEGISFVEAVQKLSEKAGVTVAEYVSDKNDDQRIDGKMMDAHELLKKYYHHLLLHAEEGKEALRYLLDRGISKEMIEAFELGYAGASWNHGAKVLQKRGYSLVQMEQSGLVSVNEKEEHYDRFRSRIMFPIHNAQGKTIAFSGRTLDGGTPKYLNSPETPIFHKGHVLYHFHKARPAMRQKQQVLLFEGFADVIAAVGSGFEESIATMGTALTIEQANLLKNTVKTVILCYDGDKAGQEAIAKAGHVLLKTGCTIKVVVIPQRLDPDEYIRTYGAVSFRKLVENSISFVSFQLQHLRSGMNLQDFQERENYVQAVEKELAKLASYINVGPYLESIAREFQLDGKKLYRKILGFRHNKEHPKPEAKQIDKSSRFEKAERELLYHALQSREIANQLQPHLQYFVTEKHAGILCELYAYYEKGYEPDREAFLVWLKNDEMGKIVSSLDNNEMINKEYQQKSFEGNLQTLREHREQVEKHETMQRILETEKIDPIAAAKLVQRKIVDKKKVKQ